MSQATPGIQTSCISSQRPVQGFTQFLSELLSGLSPSWRWMVLPFPQGCFIHSSCLYGSAMFAKNRAPGVCGILRLMIVSLAYRSHHPTFAKRDGPARQHLPVWWDNLSPFPFFWADGCSQCWTFLILFQHRCILPFC